MVGLYHDRYFETEHKQCEMEVYQASGKLTYTSRPSGSSNGSQVDTTLYAISSASVEELPVPAVDENVGGSSSPGRPVGKSKEKGKFL